jgi:hypothetical protein
VDDAALVQAAEVIGRHPEVRDILRKKVACRRLEDREATAENEGQAREQQE